ncbi:flagellar protein FlaG [Bacillus piscicola]|uniref:flagellar protein FlaG n=1 Tax=Bacillus piscicola TaxID=1632684 RepID=UPI001F098E41|nr:flagellar protein FlaG [Bacillus piscicola]
MEFISRSMPAANTPITPQLPGTRESDQSANPVEKLQQAVEYHKREQVDAAELQDQVESMNSMLESNYTNLKFNVHEQLDRVYVQVLERDSEEVIREIPPKKFLDMVASMLEQIGLLVDEKV